MKWLRWIFFIILLIFISNVCSQNLQITGNGASVLLLSTPTEHWLITKEGADYKIYTSDFQLIDSFNLGSHQDNHPMICGIGRDFDSDNNIEVIYQFNDEKLQHHHIVCPDRIIDFPLNEAIRKIIKELSKIAKDPKTKEEGEKLHKNLLTYLPEIF